MLYVPCAWRMARFKMSSVSKWLPFMTPSGRPLLLIRHINTEIALPSTGPIAKAQWLALLERKKRQSLFNSTTSRDKFFQSKRLTLSNYFEKTEFAAQVLQHKIFTSDYSNAYEIDISNATIGAISSGGKGQRFESSRARHALKLFLL